MITRCITTHTAVIALLLLSMCVCRAAFVGRLSECDDSEKDASCSSMIPPSVFPPECSDLSRLVEAIQRGSFQPSSPSRWSRLEAARWNPAPNRSELVPADGRCNLPREEASTLTPERFKAMYHERQPVIIRGATDPKLFAAVTDKRLLLYCFGDFDVTLSTANKNSYDKYEAALRYYVNTMMEPLTLNASGVGTKYMFGDNRHEEWDAVFQHYARPSQYIWSHISLSFGLGGSGSGVPFHTHGAVFADVMHGEKRWFLQAPGIEPRFDPDESSLRWATLVYPTYSDEERDKILDCVVSQGEFIYIPSHWHHATLNIGQTVFMSAFV